MKNLACFYFLPPFTMHYCVYVFISRDGDIEKLVDLALAPFSEELVVAPYKVHLDAGEIEAMAEHYRVKPTDLVALTNHMHGWRGVDGGVDENGLFALTCWNPAGKWDWYEIGGRWDGLLRGNVVRAATLTANPKLKELLPFAIVPPDGTWFERETLVSQGWAKWQLERRKPREWLRFVQNALKKNPQYRVVCVDIHS